LRDRLKKVSAMDERLELTTSMDLGRLEELVRKLSESTNSDWDIITSLLDLVARLLGYDWLDGEIHRHVIFFRDKDQENFDHDKMFPMKDAFYDPVRHLGVRYATVNHLNKKGGLNRNQIARALGINEYMVSQILDRISEFESREGTTFPTLERPDRWPIIHDYGYQRKRGDRLIDWKTTRRRRTK
jgi:DNA-directed RNA polymerase specialized sigma subunit